MKTLPVNKTNQAIASHLGELSASGNFNVPALPILEAFEETKLLTDHFIADYECAGYLEVFNPKKTQLCVALTVEAFEQLGYALRTAKAGQNLNKAIMASGATRNATSDLARPPNICQPDPIALSFTLLPDVSSVPGARYLKLCERGAVLSWN